MVVCESVIVVSEAVDAASGESGVELFLAVGEGGEW